MNFFTRRQRNRDWVLLALIFLLGLLLMLLTGTLAIGLTPQWTVKASMDSMLNPNAQYVALKGTQFVVEPVSPDILTPPTWQPTDEIPSSTPTRSGGSDNNPTATRKSPSETKSANRTSTPARTNTQQATGSATAQITPSKTFIVIFPSSTSKSATSTAKPALTSTPSKTASVTKTPTPTKTATRTRTFTPTITLTPTVTFTPTITLTRTKTFTPTITVTWTETLTPTVTLTPTPTFTPTITVTPSITLTPTWTATATPVLINFGPPDGVIDTPPDGASRTFFLSTPINDHGNNSYDFVYYERATGPTSIQMDQVIVQVSQNGSSWSTVFNWGDDLPDANTNLNFITLGFPDEGDNTNVSGPFLIGGSGIGIDLFDLGLIGNYPWVRFTCPNNGGGDGCDIDAIEIYP